MDLSSLQPAPPSPGETAFILLCYTPPSWIPGAENGVIRILPNYGDEYQDSFGKMEFTEKR